MAVARATIPLVFYDQAEFAKAMSMIALPLNLASAISPPLLAGLLTQFGSRGALGLTLAVFLRDGADPDPARPPAPALGCGSRDLRSTG